MKKKKLSLAMILFAIAVGCFSLFILLPFIFAVIIAIVVMLGI